MVSEGDLIGRRETEHEKRRDWWLMILAEASEIAALLAQHRIKRVPVVREGMIVGIVASIVLPPRLPDPDPTFCRNTDDVARPAKSLRWINRLAAAVVRIDADQGKLLLYR